MQHAYNVIIKHATITVSFGPSAEVSFNNYEDPADRILSSKHVGE